jgi:hypothetical protein
LPSFVLKGTVSKSLLHPTGNATVGSRPHLNYAPEHSEHSTIVLWWHCADSSDRDT